jgi:hypothetical protein
MLMEHETAKLKELEEGYGKELKDWKSDLKPRKQVRLGCLLFFKLYRDCSKQCCGSGSAWIRTN